MNQIRQGNSVQNQGVDCANVRFKKTDLKSGNIPDDFQKNMNRLLPCIAYLKQARVFGIHCA